MNTFDDLEHQVLTALSSILPPVFSISPLNLLVNQIAGDDHSLKQIVSNLWKEVLECLQWLDTKEPNSVVHVNFGSLTVATATQLEEFAWGLANSNKNFLWVIRPDSVMGSQQCCLRSSCRRPKTEAYWRAGVRKRRFGGIVRSGVFWTYSCWNSTLESITSGVPVICWPFAVDQPTNCQYSCTEWGIGMEIDDDVKRDEVERLVRELMDGEKGKEMKRNAMEWKRKAEEASVGPAGKSYMN